MRVRLIWTQSVLLAPKLLNHPVFTLPAWQLKGVQSDSLFSVNLDNLAAMFFCVFLRLLSLLSLPYSILFPSNSLHPFSISPAPSSISGLMSSPVSPWWSFVCLGRSKLSAWEQLFQSTLVICLQEHASLMTPPNLLCVTCAAGWSACLPWITTLLSLRTPSRYFTVFYNKYKSQIKLTGKVSELLHLETEKYAAEICTKLSSCCVCVPAGSII